MSALAPALRRAPSSPPRRSVWRPVLGWSIAAGITLVTAAVTLVIGVFLGLSVGEMLHYGYANSSETWTVPKGHDEEAVVTTTLAAVAHFLVWFVSLAAAAITAACTHKSVWWSLAIITIVVALEIGTIVVIQHVRFEAGMYLG